VKRRYGGYPTGTLKEGNKTSPQLLRKEEEEEEKMK
jgi:hypothetical protein